MSPVPAEIRLPLTLYPSRFAALLLAASSVALAAFCAWFIGRAPWLFGVSVAFLVALALVFASDCLPQAAYLRLTAEGFGWRRFYLRRQAYRWKDVDRFEVDWSDESPTVKFRLSPSYRERHGIRALTGNDSAASRLLADNYGMKPKDLAALLNDLRQCYG